MTQELFSLDDLGLQSEVNFYSDDDVFSRLIYLLETMRINLPTWLVNKLPFADSLSKPLVLWSVMMKSAHRKGSVYGEGSIDEFKQCLDKIIQPELKTFEERKRFWDWANTLSNGLFDENKETWLEDIEEGQSIEKFNSGFTPFDQVTKGFYESIVTVAGEPGAGKTSVLLSFMGALASKYQIWYFQTEIPDDLIKQRISLVKPKTIIKGSKVFCGNYSSADILEKVKKDPNPDRIIIYDSPEINTEEDEIKYFKKVYQDLVAIKQVSKMVVVTSQIKQGITWDQLGIYSLSGAASKARYTDIIIYVGRIYDTLLVKTAKNRFGQLGNTSNKFDYETLSIQEDYVKQLFGDN